MGQWRKSKFEDIFQDAVNCLMGSDRIFCFNRDANETSSMLEESRFSRLSFFIESIWNIGACHHASSASRIQMKRTCSKASKILRFAPASSSASEMTENC